MHPVSIKYNGLGTAFAATAKIKQASFQQAKQGRFSALAILGAHEASRPFIPLATAIEGAIKSPIHLIGSTSPKYSFAQSLIAAYAVPVGIATSLLEIPLTLLSMPVKMGQVIANPQKAIEKEQARLEKQKRSVALMQNKTFRPWVEKVKAHQPESYAAMKERKSLELLLTQANNHAYAQDLKERIQNQGAFKVYKHYVADDLQKTCQTAVQTAQTIGESILNPIPAVIHLASPKGLWQTITKVVNWMRENPFKTCLIASAALTIASAAVLTIGMTTSVGLAATAFPAVLLYLTALNTATLGITLLCNKYTKQMAI